MTNVKKRSAAPLQREPASHSSAAHSPKKRRMDNLPKFYAVKAGKRPGVYMTYPECQAQTAGFKGAVFKSFTSRDDAEAFVAGKAVRSGSNEPEKFYAVAVGNPTGIFSDWSDASKSIKGVKGPKYKRFGTHGEAVEYIKQYGNLETLEALGLTGEQGKKKTKKDAKKDKADAEADNVLRIYTDGSSRSNGREGAKAGFGVFFGQGDPRNVSEPLRGEPQTNQRAELMAMQRALEVAPKAQDVEIVSDSQYSINCVTQWATSWRSKGWKTAVGEDVKNQDIIQAVLSLMETRSKAGGKTTFKWVKGHSKDAGNTAADLLAVKGATMG